jgi:hypothetical protein
MELFRQVNAYKTSYLFLIVSIKTIAKNPIIRLNANMIMFSIENNELSIEVLLLELLVMFVLLVLLSLVFVKLVVLLLVMLSAVVGCCDS